MTDNPKELLANIAPFGLRMQADLKERIKHAAERNGRSMNAEIVSTLEDAYPDPRQFREELRFLDEIDDIQRRLDKIRAARLAEASENFTEAFIEENAEKIRGKRGRSKKRDEDPDQ